MYVRDGRCMFHPICCCFHLLVIILLLSASHIYDTHQPYTHVAFYRHVVMRTNKQYVKQVIII